MLWNESQIENKKNSINTYIILMIIYCVFLWVPKMSELKLIVFIAHLLYLSLICMVVASIHCLPFATFRVWLLAFLESKCSAIEIRTTTSFTMLGTLNEGIL